jgi:hypothetical protein
MKKLYCPVCQKLIQDCECGDGCAVCARAKAIYALQVCGDCVELPESDEMISTHQEGGEVR